MEKYGVDLDDERKKEASDGGELKCPNCAWILNAEQANVPICPVCGTKPWESTDASRPK